MCGRHNAKKIDLGCFPEIKQTLTNLQMPQSFPWHGAVVDLMRQVLFAHLRDKYREAEVLEFMRHVESIAEVQQEMEGDQ